MTPVSMKPPARSAAKVPEISAHPLVATATILEINAEDFRGFAHIYGIIAGRCKGAALISEISA